MSATTSIAEIRNDERNNLINKYIDHKVSDLYKDRPKELVSFYYNYCRRNIFEKYKDSSTNYSSYKFKDKDDVKDMCNKVKENYYKKFKNVTDIEFDCEEITSIFGVFRGYNLVIKNENPYE